MAYFASLGYTPGVLLDFKDHPGETQVVVFHGDKNPKQQGSIRQAKAMLSALSVKAHFVEVPNTWRFEDCYAAIKGEYDRLQQPKSLVVNASGGTEVLNSALTLFAALVGAEARYVDRASWKASRVNFAALQEWFALTGSRRAIVESLARSGGARSVRELVQDLGVTPGAVSQTLSGLARDGLLTVSPRGEGRRKVAALDESLWLLTATLSPKASAFSSRDG